MEKIIQITSGRGPVECCWVVAQILKVFLKETLANGIQYTILDKENGIENGTIASVSIQIEGQQLEAFLSDWIGTIQWIGQSKFRKFHKRKNWFVGFSELSIETNKKIDDRDIKYEATRAGGPGGQHVNKVSTAIRATHIPTNVAVLASDSRSQSQNKKNAKSRLINLIQVKELENRSQNIRDNWQNHNELVRGNPTRVYQGPEFKLIKQKRCH